MWFQGVMQCFFGSQMVVRGTFLMYGSQMVVKKNGLKSAHFDERI